MWTGGFVDPAGQPELTATTDFPNDPALWQAGAGTSLPFTGPPGQGLALASLALLITGVSMVVVAKRRARE